MLAAEARGFILGARSPSASERASCPRASRASSLTITSQRRVPARVRARRAGDARATRSAPASACSCTTTCWPRAGRRGRCATSPSSAARRSAAARSCRARVPRRPRPPRARRGPRARRLRQPSGDAHDAPQPPGASPQERCGTWSPTRTTCRAGGPGSSASRTSGGSAGPSSCARRRAAACGRPAPRGVRAAAPAPLEPGARGLAVRQADRPSRSPRSGSRTPRAARA